LAQLRKNSNPAGRKLFASALLMGAVWRCHGPAAVASHALDEMVKSYETGNRPGERFRYAPSINAAVKSNLNRWPSKGNGLDRDVRRTCPSSVIPLIAARKKNRRFFEKPAFLEKTLSRCANEDRRNRRGLPQMLDPRNIFFLNERLASHLLEDWHSYSGGSTPSPSIS